MLDKIIKHVIIPSTLATSYALIYSLFEKHNPLLKRSLMKTIINLFIVQIIVVYIFDKYKRQIPQSNDFNIFIIPLKMFLINLFFGMGHKLLHTKLLYKFHKHHHQYIETNAIAAFDVSLVEFCFSYILPAIFTDIIILVIYKKDFPLINLVFIYLLLFKSYHIHVEKPFKYDPMNLIPYRNIFHTIHHKTPDKNFCAPFFEGIF